MSGGSFDQMYSRSGEELLAMPRVMERMYHALRKGGSANFLSGPSPTARDDDHPATRGAMKAAKQTEKILQLISSVHLLVDDDLRAVWKAVEMYMSGDWGRQRMEQVLSGYAKR